MKTIDKWAWMAAWDAADEYNYVPLDDNAALFSAAYEDPEACLLRKEHEQAVEKTFKNLSDEAKQIVRMIIESPAEILEMLGVKSFRGVTTQKIEEALCRQWRDEKKYVRREDRRFVKKIIGEIKNFVSCFE
ncbi:MAG: hypothetical protein WC428_07830 [Candidatus Paceibacterota bacterium]|jgi:hypothetical protein